MRLTCRVAALSIIVALTIVPTFARRANIKIDSRQNKQALLIRIDQGKRASVIVKNYDHINALVNVSPSLKYNQLTTENVRGDTDETQAWRGNAWDRREIGRVQRTVALDRRNLREQRARASTKHLWSKAAVKLLSRYAIQIEDGNVPDNIAAAKTRQRQEAVVALLPGDRTRLLAPRQEKGWLNAPPNLAKVSSNKSNLLRLRDSPRQI